MSRKTCNQRITVRHLQKESPEIEISTSQNRNQRRSRRRIPSTPNVPPCITRRESLGSPWSRPRTHRHTQKEKRQRRPEEEEKETCVARKTETSSKFRSST